MRNSNTAKSDIISKSINLKHDRKTLAVISLSASVAGLSLVLAFLKLATLHHFIFASLLLIIGTFLILLVSFHAMQSAHELRLHRLLTAMTAAEQARAQAEASAREKSRLLATMSHEIRTPLNGVIGMIGLLLETELSSEQQNYAATAKASGRTLLSILDEILDTSKVQAVKPNHQIDIVTVIENVTELLAPRAQAKDIDISAHVAVDVPRSIAIDELALRQIFFNLAGNAIKFTQQGGVAIDVRLDVQDQLIITIRDSGIGMTQDEVGRVFEEYIQANENTSKQFGGTGLGLAISRKLIMAMGGTILVESKINEGTVFSITFPGPFHREQNNQSNLMANREFIVALKDGIVANHLISSLREFGANVILLGDVKALQAALNSENSSTQIISDLSYSSTLKKWSKQVPAKSRDMKVWVVMKAEDRRTHKLFMKRPFAGYLLTPTRRETLLSLLLGGEDTTSDKTVKMLRSVVSAGRARTVRRNGLNVLLAEDNPINALLAKTMLERCGHKVQIVNNGQAALELIENGAKIDLALLDIEMPKLNGYEVAKAIRLRETKLNKLPMPILALTGNVRPEDIAACLDAGMNDHLAKPFDQLDLEEKIESLIGKKVAA